MLCGKLIARFHWAPWKWLWLAYLHFSAVFFRYKKLRNPPKSLFLLAPRRKWPGRWVIPTAKASVPKFFPSSLLPTEAFLSPSSRRRLANSKQKHTPRLPAAPTTTPVSNQASPACLAVNALAALSCVNLLSLPLAMHARALSPSQQYINWWTTLPSLSISFCLRNPLAHIQSNRSSSHSFTLSNLLYLHIILNPSLHSFLRP